ncbi:MAG: hypothetical protein ACYC3X_10610 [Pirellulaceae bacterium]
MQWSVSTEEINEFLPAVFQVAHSILGGIFSTSDICVDEGTQSATVAKIAQASVRKTIDDVFRSLLLEPSCRLRWHGCAVLVGIDEAFDVTRDFLRHLPTYSTKPDRMTIAGSHARYMTVMGQLSEQSGRDAQGLCRFAGPKGERLNGLCCHRHLLQEVRCYEPRGSHTPHPLTATKNGNFPRMKRAADACTMRLRIVGFPGCGNLTATSCRVSRHRLVTDPIQTVGRVYCAARAAGQSHCPFVLCVSEHTTLYSESRPC